METQKHCNNITNHSYFLSVTPNCPPFWASSHRRFGCHQPAILLDTLSLYCLYQAAIKPKMEKSPIFRLATQGSMIIEFKCQDIVVC
ncbi:hypothetical protein SAMN02745866_00032 [Alteromonadaceae bacterium Bs31]|nr:hypothetical protein SAMN02745866_00032 [Alteromonadaceae bacterium Bs31]